MFECFDSSMYISAYTTLAVMYFWEFPFHFLDLDFQDVTDNWTNFYYQDIFNTSSYFKNF